MAPGAKMPPALMMNVPQGITPEESVEMRVKKVTKGHEIVDIGGFTLKRRKTQVPTGLPSGAPASDSADLQHLKTPNSPTQRGPSATCSRIPHVDEYEISEELYHRLSHSLEALPEAAAPEHRFAAVCTSVCDAEVDLAAKSGNPSLAAALADVFNAFNLSLPKAVAAGSVQLVAPVPAAEEIDQEDLKIDLHARKAGLRGRLQKFQEEEAEWQALLAKVEALDGNAQPAEEQAEASPEEQPAAAPSAEVAALRQLQQEVHRSLTLQVDGVCLLVGDVEELVVRANHSAQAMQAQVHAQRFSTFLHINSPAHLIKALVRPRAAPAGGTALT